MAFARNGDPWKLGRDTAATNITRLAGGAGVNGPMVRITNNSDGADDTALELVVEPTEPPMKVSSSTKVDSLNADWLDDKNASDFVQPDTNEFFRNSMFEYTSDLSTGTQANDGTYFIDMSCPSSLKTDPN